MGLTKAQQSLLTRARTAGTSALGVPVDDGVCCYLLGVIVQDLALSQHFSELPAHLPSFFSPPPLAALRIEQLPFLSLFERLVALQEDTDTYFYCLATLHKAHLKYERILQTQAIPTLDQVGPRALLQYGGLSSSALAGLLFWRKWLFDLDNRAGQETGYVFEPIIARAIGGVSFSALKSPVRRGGAGAQGRQVDCIRDQKAYEIKLRVTIAASGQGRWAEELQFPRDCQASGYTPVLLVLDPTSNPKLTELSRAFRAAAGEVYIGPMAWDHLAATAGPTMAHFLQLYVHAPIQALLQTPLEQLPDLLLHMDKGQILITIGSETLLILRREETR